MLKKYMHFLQVLLAVNCAKSMMCTWLHTSVTSLSMYLKNHTPVWLFVNVVCPCVYGLCGDNLLTRLLRLFLSLLSCMSPSQVKCRMAIWRTTRLKVTKPHPSSSPLSSSSFSSSHFPPVLCGVFLLVKCRCERNIIW